MYLSPSCVNNVQTATVTLEKLIENMDTNSYVDFWLNDQDVNCPQIRQEIVSGIRGIDPNLADGSVYGIVSITRTTSFSAVVEFQQYRFTRSLYRCVWYKENGFASWERVFVLNKNLDNIGTVYYSNTLLTTTVDALSRTRVLDITGMPKGKYILSAQINGTTTTTKGALLSVYVGNGVIRGCNTIPSQLSGFVLNAGITTIIETNIDNDLVSIYFYPTDAQKLTSGNLTLVRIG